jgi:hypothetical protein
MTVTPDRFDEMRRAWIAANQGWSTIQRRRAELLGRRVRARQREVASAVPDPHDDTILPPLGLRTAHSPAAQVELAIVLLAAAVAPLGWLAGWAVKSLVTQLIPQKLRAFPVAAMLWSGAVLGSLIVLTYDPAPTFGQAVLAPWACVQVATVPVVAGIYGIAEGWLAVPGSTQWWPLTPPKPPLTAEDAAAILGPYDTTGPGLMDAQRLNRPGERSR